MRVIPFLVLGLVLAVAPGTAAGQIKRVGGASTSSAAYVEVGLKREAGKRVKVKLVPATGRATTIRELVTGSTYE